ncbi:MAG: helix-hairpin-helix domain-containing protein [Bacteroidales bacterium]|nr:helix-hairpin-helix domain-containing protein [Bacteroidales bacterium]
MSRRLYREFYLLPRGEQRALILLSLLLILSLLFRITVQLLPDREPEGMEKFEQEARMIMASFARADSLQRVRSDSIRRKVTGNSGHAIPYTYPDKRRNSALPIDINRADSAQLLPLPGIGPVYAGRIIKYRNLLGGFFRVEQLGEVYGMPDETLGLIRDKIYVDTAAIRKIQLDSASFRELLRHPYLELEDVKAIVNYRDFKGTIESPKELQENFILPDSVLQRVLPYLDL